MYFFYFNFCFVSSKAGYGVVVFNTNQNSFIDKKGDDQLDIHIVQIYWRKETSADYFVCPSI